MKLHLGGSLAWHDRHRRTNLEVSLDGSAPLEAVLQRLAIPKAEVALVVVNGELVTETNPELHDTDDVKLYPPMGGGSLW